MLPRVARFCAGSVGRIVHYSPHLARERRDSTRSRDTKTLSYLLVDIQLLINCFFLLLFVWCVLVSEVIQDFRFSWWRIPRTIMQYSFNRIGAGSATFSTACFDVLIFGWNSSCFFDFSCSCSCWFNPMFKFWLFVCLMWFTTFVLVGKLYSFFCYYLFVDLVWLCSFWVSRFDLNFCWVHRSCGFGWAFLIRFSGWRDLLSSGEVADSVVWLSAGYYSQIFYICLISNLFIWFDMLLIFSHWFCTNTDGLIWRLEHWIFILWCSLIIAWKQLSFVIFVIFLLWNCRLI